MNERFIQLLSTRVLGYRCVTNCDRPCPGPLVLVSAASDTTRRDCRSRRSGSQLATCCCDGGKNNYNVVELGTFLTDTSTGQFVLTRVYFF